MSRVIGQRARQRATAARALHARSDPERCLLDERLVAEARRYRGDAFLNQRENDKALSDYDDAIRLDPKNAMAYVSRGMVWTEKEDADKALADLEAVGKGYRRMAAGEWIDVRAPYDGELLGRVPACGAEQVEAGVRAAKAALAA